VGALTNASGTAATWVGPITLGSASTIGSSAAGGLTLSGAATVTLGANTLTLRTTGTGRIYTDGVISGTGAVVMNSSGTGDWVPRADHTYSGGTTLTAGLIAVDRDSIGSPGSPTSGPFGTGTLTIAGGQIRSGTGPLAGRLVGNAVTMSGNPTFYTVVGERDLTFTGPVTLTGGNRTFTSDVGATVAGTSTIFTGAIGDGGNALGLIKAGTGNLTLGGANTYTGGTTVNAGRLIVTGSLATSTALAVVPTVAGGASFTLGSGAANPLANVSALTLDSTAGPVALGFDLGANTAASDSITTAAAATTSGTVNLSIQALAGFGSASTYDLISAAGGLNGATYVLANAPGGFNYSLNTSGTLVQLGVTPATAGDRYWRGDISNSWSSLSGSNTNWYSDAAGSTNALTSPAAGDTVNFSAVNAITAGGVITTTLDNNFTVNDLVFGDTPNGVTSVTIAGGATPGGVPGVLSIAPTSSADGIGVGSNAGNVTISAPVLLGAAQTWSVDGTGANGSTLTVSGALSGSAALTVNGLVTLSAGASSTHSGATTVPNGSVLQGGAANSFSASTAVAVDATGIVRLNGFNNRAASLTGAGTLQNNHASTGATLTVGDATNFSFVGTLQNGAAAALGLTKIGTGSLTLSGANTHTGATTVNEGTLVFGTATTLTGTNPVTLTGTGTLDINGFSVSTGAITSAVATSTITNSSPSTAPSTATALNTPSGAGIYVDALNSASAGNIAALITDGPTRKTQVVINNANGNAQLTNDSNTFSGGLVLLDNPTGTRLNISTAIAGARFGTGPLVIGQAPTDRAGVFFNGVDNTLGLPIFMNTALGTDRFGIRNDGRAITLSGLITANSDVTFSSNSATASNTIITNQITGAGGLAVDLSQTSTANTLHTVTLGAAANANNYAGDTQIGRTNVAPGQNYTAALALGAADQIPDGAGKGNVIITNNSATRTGTLRLAGFSETINGLSGNGNVDGVSGTLTLTLGGNDAPGNFSGNILNGSGTLTVTKIGTGTQTFSGASTFTGPLNVNGGVVAFPSSPATAGPLGNSTVVNLSGGGISFTSAGANNLNRPVAIGGSAGTVDVANATGALSLAASSTGGDLVKTGPGSASLTGSTELNLAANGAGVVVSNGTLQAGFGVTDVATVSVGATGNLNLADSAAETLTLENSSGALTLNGGAQLGFDLIGAGNDGIAVAVGGTAATSGTVTLNFFGTPTATTYTLLAADSGLNGATYALGAAPSGFNYTINATATTVTLTVTAELPVYWRDGQANGLWSTLGSPANWTSDAAGTVDAATTPLSGNAVIFSATGATAASTLDAAFTVDSLRFANTHTITASGPGALTLNPASTSGGLRVLSGGLTATISAPLTTGAAQTWDVDATGSLIISGNTVFNANVTKTNTGALTLSGTNSGTGAITLAGGTLNLNSATALGGGLFTIGAGTTLNTPAGAIALTTNNAQTWNGDFTFTGANNLDLGTGAVTLGNSVAINTAGSTLTVGGAIGDGGSNRGLTKAGTGTIVLIGANSYGGLTTINAGVLRITNGAGLGTTVAGTTQSGTSALELDGTGGDITLGAEALIINGGGVTLPTPNLGALRNIAGNNTYGGTVTMGIQSRINSDSGTLTLSNPTAVSATNLTLVVGGAGNTTISGAIATGTGGVAKDGAGTLTLSGTNTYTGVTGVAAGTLTLTSGGSITPTGNVVALSVSGATAVVNIAGTYTSAGGAGVAINTGGILNTSGTLAFSGTGTQALFLGTAGGSGTWNVTGGTVSINYPANGFGLGNGGVGTLNVSAGSVTTPGPNVLNVGHAASGTGNLNISGTGLVTVNAGSGLFRIGANATSTGTVNLDGGTLALGRNVVTVAGSISTFNFNGGLLSAGLTSTTYLQGLTRANVRDGGALINTNGFDITVGQALLHSDLGGDLAIDGGLTKSGTGILTLSGANTYTGATLVSNGKLQLNGNAAPLTTLATSGVTVEAAGTLGFTAAAASTLDLTGKDMTLNGGTLAFDIGDAGVNDSITVNNFALTANSAFSFTSIGAIGGSYTLVNSATPITNAGPYTISGQTIGRVTLTPTVGTNTITVSSSVFEGKWALTGGGNWSLGDPNATQDNWLNYKPTVPGDAALFGDTITAPSTVAVDTPHIAGYLRFDNANAYTIGANGSSNLTLNNGTSNAVATVTSGSHTIAENVALLSHLDVIPAAGTTLTVSGVVSGATRNIEVNGPGDVLLSGVNTYGGTTTVSNGTLTLSGARTATMGAVTVGNLTSSTATLNISAGTFTTGTFSVGSGNNSSSTITIGGAAQVTLSAFPNAKGTDATATITLDSTTGFLSPTAASATYMPAGTFTNAYLTANGAKFDVPTGRDITVGQVLADAVSPAAVGTLTKSGVGGLTLSGANLYSGLTTVSAGTIGLGSADALGTTAAGTTVASGARVTFGALTTASTVAEAFDIAGNGTATNGVFNVGGSKTINLSGPITLTADARITVDGGAAFNLINAAAVTGTDVSLTFHTDGSAASSITGTVSLGTGSLTKSSTSTLVLSGNNSYSGGSSITGGVLQANNNDALGSGTVALNGGIRLAVNAGVDIPNAVTLGTNAGAVGRGLVEAVGVSGTAIVSGPITITNGALAGGHFNAAAGTILELRGAITSTLVDGVTGRTTFSHRAGNVMFSGGGTGYQLLTIGQGTTIVGANNGIATTARVNIGASAAGNLDLNGFNQSLDGITKGAFAGIIGNSSTTTDSVLTTTGVSTYAGIIQNTLGAGTRKVGLVVDSGALTLSGANSYTGDTVVNAAGTFELVDNAQIRFALGSTSGDNNDLTGAGTATLDGDFVIDTSAADALATGTWTLEDVTTLTGAYGANFTVVGFTNIGGDKWEKAVDLTKKYTFDEATGILTLGPSASYASWIAGFGLAGLDAAATADPDFDGIENAVEMVLGGNPATGMDTALLPTIELVNADPDGDTTFSDYLLFTYRRTDLSVTAGVTAACESDTDLVAPWSTAVGGVSGVVILTDDNYGLFTPPAADTDRVRVFVPRGVNTTLFGRLNVQVP
jgi:autotransporter-associated beta strand protein